jgi:hypothetical protein
MKLLYSLFTLLPGVLALGQNQTVSLKSGPKLLQLAGRGLDGQILVSSNDWWGVVRAAEDLAGDIGKVTGRNLTLGNWKNKGTKPDNKGDRTTVTYEYREPTNDINVSTAEQDLWVTADILEVHSWPYLEIHWPNTSQQCQGENCDHCRHNREIRRD